MLVLLHFGMWYGLWWLFHDQSVYFVRQLFHSYGYYYPIIELIVGNLLPPAVGYFISPFVNRVLFGFLRSGKGFLIGLRKSREGRWMYGRYIDGIMAIAMALLFCIPLGLAMGTGVAIRDRLGHAAVQWAALYVLIALLVGWGNRKRLRPVVGRLLRPIQRIYRARLFGMGGSGTYAGLLEEWCHMWKPGRVLLGTSTYDRNLKIGIEEDRHIFTCVGSRVGKGKDSIIPNLLTYPGSAMVIDPKAQNALVTALARGSGLKTSLGQNVYILDPLGEIKRLDLLSGVSSASIISMVSRLNPLDWLNPEATDYVDRIFLIASSMIVSSGHENHFFDTAAHSVISGCIDFVKRYPEFKPEERNLGMVRDLITKRNGLPLGKMAALGGLAEAAAVQLGVPVKQPDGSIRASMDSRTRDSIMSTVLNHTKWLASKGVREMLSTSDFKLTDLNDGNTTDLLPGRRTDRQVAWQARILGIKLGQSIYG